MSYRKAQSRTYNVSMNLDADYGGLSWQVQAMNADDAREKSFKQLLKIVKRDMEVEREDGNC